MSYCQNCYTTQASVSGVAYSCCFVSHELLPTMVSQVSHAVTRYQSMQLAGWPAWVFVGGYSVTTVVGVRV